MYYSFMVQKKHPRCCPARETRYNWAMRRSPLGIRVLGVCILVLAACSQADATPTSTTVPTPTVDRASMDGDRVAVHYTGTLDSGEEFDSSRDRGPLSFVLGAGEMISGFDAAVNGMKVGDTVTVRLEPEDAYGERRDDLIMEFPIDQLRDGQGEGDSLLFQSGSRGIIVEITDEVFRVDANHRLAGQALTFEIELVSIE